MCHTVFMYEFEDIEPGIQMMFLTPEELYPNYEKYSRFEERICEFLAVEPISEIMDYSDGVISYLTESVIPVKQNFRPPLLLLFGNPAPSSVRNKCFFARKQGKKDHRLWPTLEKADIISFRDTNEDINTFRTKALFEFDYISPFRVGLAVFHSIPSPASGYPWSGVNGLRKLFGKKAFEEIAEYEKKRLEHVIQGFIGDNPRGAVIAFQKDAFLGLKDDKNQENVIAEEGKWCVVKTQCAFSGVKLFWMPPTRFMSAHWYVKFLRLIIGDIMGE